MTHIEECNFSHPAHRQAIIDLMNHYMEGTMGGNLKPHSSGKAQQMLDGLAAHPAKLILLAKKDNSYIGLANCFIGFGTFAAKPYYNVHDLVVLENYRGKGIGRMLLEYVIEKARELNFGKVTLEVREDNLGAQHLYQSMGFGESNPAMHFWSKYL
jgi:ribosomal protein S18 acetylase RimI-like enzyme